MTNKTTDNCNEEQKIAELKAFNEKGEQYYYGDDVAQDYYEAFKWYKKAAEQGNQNAKDILKQLGY